MLYLVIINGDVALATSKFSEATSYANSQTDTGALVFQVTGHVVLTVPVAPPTPAPPVVPPPA